MKPTNRGTSRQTDAAAAAATVTAAASQFQTSLRLPDVTVPPVASGKNRCATIFASLVCSRYSITISPAHADPPTRKTMKEQKKSEGRRLVSRTGYHHQLTNRRCLCVSVCVCPSERERKRKREREVEREGETET